MDQGEPSVIVHKGAEAGLTIAHPAQYANPQQKSRAHKGPRWQKNLKRLPHFSNKIFYELINIYQSQESCFFSFI